ncbi:nucleotidyltransferase domain-containing protein [Flexivirga caeni]|uniref:Nucleotidyltransferase domain-containing protein n=1 Tax=Flexivirga caeni TaxID=2294115 RepID=A0A3M9M1F7_9MICO|nr:nucleotidyltransferase domain-containing protein [Flexivirga caeni]RNI18358.1 nucleotidyltransferase domain-containing protein [Flexivirga caeni]
MTTTAREFADRATAWAADQPSVRAVVVFGSVAQGVDNDFSDLDLILVAEPGRRAELWDARAAIAAAVMGTAPAYVQEPSWQGDFRYQVWDDELHELDLTIAEESVGVFGGIARGFVVLLDRANVEEQLTQAVASWSPPEFDAAALDSFTWPWLLGLQARLRHGERFAVRAGVVDTLMGRVVPMLGGEWHSAETQLSAADMERVHDALPQSAEVAELSRSLRETALVYDWALDRWAERTGNDRPSSPLAALAHARLADPAAAIPSDE